MRIKGGHASLPSALLADGIIFHDQSIDPEPIHDSADLLHSFDGPVLFNGGKKSEIGKGEIGFHFLEAHMFLQSLFI
jgi:hypothetical protein